MTSTAIVAYLLLFAAVAFLFVLASLLLGKLLRPAVPTAQKVETYECGEPAIGPGFGQFDLRFYVVALLFLIFEVEVAFFFPPATVFGKATHLLAKRGDRSDSVVRETDGDEGGFRGELVPCGESCCRKPPPSPCRSVGAHDDFLTPSSASTLAIGAMLDLGVFFAVLLVGFAYIWRCGDLNWVRAVGHPRSAAEDAAMTRQLRSDNWP